MHSREKREPLLGQINHGGALQDCSQHNTSYPNRSGSGRRMIANSDHVTQATDTCNPNALESKSNNTDDPTRGGHNDYIVFVHRVLQWRLAFIISNCYLCCSVLLEMMRRHFVVRVVLHCNV